MILKKRQGKKRQEQKPVRKPAQEPAQKPKLCHSGLTEILPRVWVGRIHDIEDLAAAYRFDRIYALASVDSLVWSAGWRGVIEAVPIADMGTLPQDLLDRTVRDILRRSTAGETVAFGCMGGHGRTGYLAAALLGVARPEVDPIATVRSRYCAETVESEEQIQSLAAYLGRDFSHHGPTRKAKAWWDAASEDGTWWWSNVSAATASATTQPKPQKGRIPYAQRSAFLGHDAVEAISRVARVPREQVDLLSEVVSPEVTDSEEPVLLYGSHLWWVDPIGGFAVTEQRQEDGTLAYVGYRYRLLDVAAPTTPAPGA